MGFFKGLVGFVGFFVLLYELSRKSLNLWLRVVDRVSVAIPEETIW